MLDVKILRSEMDRVQQLLQQRGADLNDLDGFIDLDKKRREKLQETEQLKSRRNQVSQEVAVKKKSGESAENLITEMKTVSTRIKGLDEEIRNIELQVNDILLSLPNLTHESVPVGQDEGDNVEVRKWGEPVSFPFQPKAHWDLGEQLDILDFEASSRVSGSRFVFYKGLGARLERALIQFMMDLHSDEHGYHEILPPMIVHEDSMIGTGQLPKFEDDAFAIRDSHFYMVPTAEVPVTNYHRESIMTLEELPKAYVAYSACFRSEAGSAGRDTRGLIRQHQFNKVELIHLTTPEQSYETLERLTTHAETVLQKLQLPYRVMSLCTGDIGFSAAKTYDIEVWLPSSDSYREISSCSNTEDFQARRANIRFKRDKKSKPEFVHTLNGSGLAVGRTVAAIVENFQQEDGSILIPEVLRPYMNGIERIR